ncbi:MAG: RsmE family RNA methyltransferase [Planctomycetota bacterium]|nr:RsmE family RNA methyltransferase [Planctomycetota bacterium]MDA1213854.1 RsmE family RNA methyltransferase [Planctomycetota bacterium]
MQPRFYLPAQYQINGTCELAGSEAHHLLHVLRLGIGAEIALFDGEGIDAEARIESLSRSSATVRIHQVGPSWDRELSPLVLCSAVPKGDRFDWLIEKSTEIGVTRFIPLLTTRSVVDPRSSKLDRLRHVVIAASKQCGRGRLMQLDTPMKFQELWVNDFAEHPMCVADPAGDTFDVLFDRLVTQTSNEGKRLTSSHALCCVVIVVGPEGGLTDEELQTADAHHAKRLTLGRSILRIETAAILAAGLFRERMHRAAD